MAVPIFVNYYLWWTLGFWESHLGSNYPYLTRPSPMPATVSSDESAIINNYVGNKELDVSDGFYYCQENTGVVEMDVCTAYQYGAAGFCVNWATISQTAYTNRLRQVIDRADYICNHHAKDQFKIILDYKGEDPNGTRDIADVITDMTYYLDQYEDRPSIHKVGGKPVIIFTGSYHWKARSGLWEALSTAIRPRAHLLASQPWSVVLSGVDFTRMMACFDGDAPYWSSQDPWENPQSHSQLKQLGDKLTGKTYAAPLSPGYDRRLLDSAAPTADSFHVPRKNGATLQQNYTGNLSGNPDLFRLISWNEISENTHIVPLRRWGNRMLDVMKMISAGP